MRNAGGPREPLQQRRQGLHDRRAAADRSPPLLPLPLLPGHWAPAAGCAPSWLGGWASPCCSLCWLGSGTLCRCQVGGAGGWGPAGMRLPASATCRPAQFVALESSRACWLRVACCRGCIKCGGGAGGHGGAHGTLRGGCQCVCARVRACLLLQLLQYPQRPWSPSDSAKVRLCGKRSAQVCSEGRLPPAHLLPRDHPARARFPDPTRRNGSATALAATVRQPPALRMLASRPGAHGRSFRLHNNPCTRCPACLELA